VMDASYLLSFSLYTTLQKIRGHPGHGGVPQIFATGFGAQAGVFFQG